MDFSLFFLLDHYPKESQSVAGIYQDVIRQSELAEQLGYRGVYLAEHHFENYGVLPNPAILLTAIAQRTQHLRLGTAISILPLHSPLQLSEDFAMLDLLSKGRAELGLGSGFLPYEFAGFGLDCQSKRERFDAALPMVEALLQQRTVELTSQHLHRGRNVQLNITTHNSRHLPIYVAAVMPESAYYIGQQGRNLMAVPFNRYASDPNAPELFLKQYQQGCLEAGISKPEQAPIMNFFCHVAHSDQQARDNIAEAFGRYVLSRTQKSEIEIPLIEIYDRWLEKGFILAGSVDTVCRQVEQYQQLGLQHMMTFHNFGGADSCIIEDSMTLFSESVMPHFQHQKISKIHSTDNQKRVSHE